MHYRAWPSIVGGACCQAGFGVAIAGLPMGDPVGFYTEVSCIIAMGNVGVDLRFLASLAEQNGGEFIHVPDSEGVKPPPAPPDSPPGPR